MATVAVRSHAPITASVMYRDETIVTRSTVVIQLVKVLSYSTTFIQYLGTFSVGTTHLLLFGVTQIALTMRWGSTREMRLTNSRECCFSNSRLMLRQNYRFTIYSSGGEFFFIFLV